jgi:hypothetical protein
MFEAYTNRHNADAIVADLTDQVAQLQTANHQLATKNDFLEAQLAAAKCCNRVEQDTGRDSVTAYEIEDRQSQSNHSLEQEADAPKEDVIQATGPNPGNSSLAECLRTTSQEGCSSSDTMVSSRQEVGKVEMVGRPAKRRRTAK